MTDTAFNQELNRLESPLKGYAISLTSDRTKAKDLLQDTFLKALSNRDKFKPNTNLKAWLYTIMRNTYFNNWRRATLVKSHVENYQTEDDRFGSVSQENPVGKYESKELWSEVTKLEDKYSVPLEMFLEGYHYKDISERTHLNIGTVKSRIFHARKKIKEVYEEDNVEARTIY